MGSKAGAVAARCFRQMMARKLMLCLMIAGMGLCVLVTFLLVSQSVDLGRISVGIIDETPDEVTEAFKEALKENKSLRCITGSREELEQMLGDGELEMIYEIRPGMKEKIKAGVTEGLFHVTCQEGNQKYLLVSDMLIGDLMSVLFSEKTNRYYQKLSGEQKDTYLSYLESLDKEELFVYQFEIYTQKNGTQTEVSGDVYLIYQQVAYGFLQTILLLFVMELVRMIRQGKKTALSVRETASGGSLVQMAGISLFAGIAIIIFTVLFQGIFAAALGMAGTQIAFSRHLGMFLWELLAVTTGYVIFYLCRIFLSEDKAYQCVTILVLLAGQMFHIVALFVPSLRDAAQYLPGFRAMLQLL